jgi:hypothetical protein
VGYRDKRLGTALGPITMHRAYYHSSECSIGVIPRDDEIGVTGVSISPGLRAMVDRVAAAAPFAKAAALIGELAGVAVSTSASSANRVEEAALKPGSATDLWSLAKRAPGSSPASGRPPVQGPMENVLFATPLLSPYSFAAVAPALDGPAPQII